MNANSKNKRWVKIIALYILFGIVASLILYIYLLNPESIFDEQLTVKDHIEFIVYFFSCIAAFIGLWTIASWGWKITILFTLFLAIYSTTDLFIINYERGMGLILVCSLLIMSVAWV